MRKAARSVCTCVFMWWTFHLTKPLGVGSLGYKVRVCLILLKAAKLISKVAAPLELSSLMFYLAIAVGILFSVSCGFDFFFNSWWWKVFWAFGVDFSSSFHWKAKWHRKIPTTGFIPQKGHKSWYCASPKPRTLSRSLVRVAFEPSAASWGVLQ